MGAASRPGISPRLPVLATAVIAVLGRAAGLLTTHAGSLFAGGKGGHPVANQAVRHPDRSRVIEQELTRWRKFAFWVHPVTSAAVYSDFSADGGSTFTPTPDTRVATETDPFGSPTFPDSGHCTDGSDLATGSTATAVPGTT